MWNNIFIAIATIATGILSWLAARHAQQTQKIHHTADHEVNKARQLDEATQTLLKGYANIVDDLRQEVGRLNTTIDDLREEQEACERRNDELASYIFDLQRRLANLEGDSSGT
jgi:septal ring factor EnvC (AmiA/AmiB activator)